MDIFSYMAPVAFVFALVAISYATQARKDVKELKNALEQLKSEINK